MSWGVRCYYLDVLLRTHKMQGTFVLPRISIDRNKDGRSSSRDSIFADGKETQHEAIAV